MEKEYVGLATDDPIDDNRFRCLKCGKNYAKKSCLEHMTKTKHGLDPDDVKKWLTVSLRTELHE